MFTHSNGYIALLAVLIVGGVSLAIGLGLLTLGTDSQRSTLVAQQSTQARSLSTACAEEALQVIHDNTSFTGTANVTLGLTGCTYTVTNTGGSARTIDTSANVNGIVRKVKIHATIGVSNISITSWQEVSAP